MFSKETYISRRQELKKLVKSGVIILFGNNNSPCNFPNNGYYPFRQDSTFLYYFGLQRDGLVGVIDIDNDIETLIGDDIDLSKVEPHLNGPFTPDAATPISHMKAKGPANDYPMVVEVGLVGSCTNSSYQDLARAASIARQAYEKGIEVKGQLIINPGSEQIRYTAERDGILDDFKKIGALIMTNACGPCIGQWKRHTDDNSRKNAIVTSFNRNFRRRADGNPNTFAFIGRLSLTREGLYISDDVMSDFMII
jgi:hypothetical protein